MFLLPLITCVFKDLIFLSFFFLDLDPHNNSLKIDKEDVIFILHKHAYTSP